METVAQEKNNSQQKKSTKKLELPVTGGGNRNLGYPE